MAKEFRLTSFERPSPAVDDDRQVIHAELERLLANPLFRNSKRYPAFLRHVVERTLAGQGSLLKERSIAVDVFDRTPDYDAGDDHIVRTTASEVRKRIAQYYQEAGNDRGVRIELPPGAYVPEFRITREFETNAVDPVVIAPQPRRRWKIRRNALLLGTIAVLALVITLAVVRRLDPAGQASARFWRPFLSPSGPVIICISPQRPLPDEPPAPSDPVDFLHYHHSGNQRVSVGDAEALARLTSLLGSEHKAFQVRRHPVALQDLRQGSIILIGGFNNDWTTRLAGDLRFRFNENFGAEALRCISDNTRPQKRDLCFDFGTPANSTTVDYALISRVADATTGGQVIIVAGISKYGTVAASEFLTDPKYLAAFDRRAPEGWFRKNVQILIRTKVISDHTGPPEILDLAVW